MITFTHRALRSSLVLVPLLASCARSGTQRQEPTPDGAGARTVTSADIGQSPGDPIEQRLMSRSPGVWVGRSADGSVAIRIRGSNSFSGNNEPLYVLDGVPYAPGSDGGLKGINPYDIASIKVLKDPADLTMYGVRGANGVILIKTKRPNQ